MSDLEALEGGDTDSKTRNTFVVEVCAPTLFGVQGGKTNDPEYQIPESLIESIAHRRLRMRYSVQAVKWATFRNRTGGIAGDTREQSIRCHKVAN